MVNKLSQTIIDFNKLDKKNIKTIKIGDEIIGPDENGQVILNGTSGGSTGGNTGGGTDPDHPTAGADYYPGSVYDGTISGRTLLYSGATSTTGKTNIVLPESVGAGLRLLGNGIQLRISIVKILITRGVVGDTSTLPVVYDIQNKKVARKFVTTSPIPISNKKEDLLTGNELVSPLNGIGNGEQSAEIKAPELHVQYDSKTNSINVWDVPGYALDNFSDTKTGSLYDVQVTLVNNYYVQNPVSQLPAEMSLFSGDTDGEVKLSGINSFFDNVGEGINVKLNDYIYISTSYGENTKRIALETLDIPSTYFIARSDLISGNKVSMNLPGSKVFDTKSDNTGNPYKIPVETNYHNTSWSKTSDVSDKIITVTEEEPFIKIGNGSVNVSLNITSSIPDIKGVVKVTSVTN